MDQLPGNQGAAPVAHENEQKQGADEGHPVAIGLLADLLPGEVADVVPHELEQVLGAAGIPFQLAGTHHHQGQESSDHDPGAQEDLAMDLEVAKLPIEVFTNLQFGKGKGERHRSQRGGSSVSPKRRNGGKVLAVEDSLENQGRLVEQKAQQGRQD